MCRYVSESYFKRGGEMCKKSVLSLIAFVGLSVVLAGCATAPRWARDEESIIRDYREGAVYGIGRGEPALGAEPVRLAAANTRARTNMRRASLNYGRELLDRFIESNEEWFDLDVKDAFLDDFEDALKPLVRLTGEISDNWVDSRGRLNGEGAVYARARQSLDRGYFNAVQAAAAEVVGKYADSLLKAEQETVLSGLEAAIEGALQDPLKALLPPEPEPEPEPEVEEDPEPAVEAEEAENEAETEVED